MHTIYAYSYIALYGCHYLDNELVDVLIYCVAAVRLWLWVEPSKITVSPGIRREVVSVKNMLRTYTHYTHSMERRTMIGGNFEINKYK